MRIVFTGYADIKAVIDSINTGGLFRYITKPWDPDELIEVLHEATREYDALVERKCLVRDACAHIEQSKLLAEGLNQPDGSALSDIDPERFVADANDLISRLQKAIVN